MSDKTALPFDTEHLAQIATALDAGRPVLCPVCGVPLMVMNVNAGKHDLPIEWLVGCARCRRTVLAKDIKFPHEAPAPSLPAAESAILPPEEGELSVLVVDDQPDFRVGTRQLLEAVGVRVLEAQDGAEALSLLRSNHVSVLMVDVFMERMSGIELLRRLRDLRGPKPRIVLVTGAAHLGEHFADAMGALFDADAVLIKPFTADQLIAALKGDLPPQVMRNSGPARRAQPQDVKPETEDARGRNV